MEKKTIMENGIIRAKLSEQIADRMEAAILGQQLEDQERLPSEQALAEDFGVSKNVVREALNILRERGLVKSRNGCGNFVTRPKADNLSNVIERMIVLNNINYHQIYDTRIILETSACHEAAGRITAKELAKLDALLERLRDNELSVQNRRETDFNFHILIAKASGNNLLVVLIQAMKNIFLDSMFLEQDIETQESIKESVVFHEKILDALSAHDARQAENAMREHLRASLKNIERIEHMDLEKMDIR